MSTHETSRDNRPGRAAGIAVWVLQALLVLFFLAAGLAKLAGTDQMVEFFDDIGLGQWLRYFTGTVEIAGALGLLVPRLAGVAALGLVGLMTGAVITNLIADTPSLLALIVLPLTVTLAWGRRDRTWALIRAGRTRS